MVLQPAARAFRRGHFLEAYESLRQSIRDSDTDAVLLAEILQFLGKGDEAERSATKLISSKRLSHDLLARCTSIIADSKWYAGALDAGLEMYQRAVTLAETSRDLEILCRSAAQLLERTCHKTGFDSSLPLATRVRRFATRSADPHIHALLHLTFGRLEAKVGHLSVAQRHFNLARAVLEIEPNLYLSSSLDLDESVVLWLAGDISAALVLAEQGVTTASTIGWSRGRVAATGNLACLYVCSGRLDDAHAQIQSALQEPFTSPSVRLALIDTKARALMASGNHQKAISILIEHQDAGEVQPWYTLTAEQTRVQALLRTSRWEEALQRSADNIVEARSAKLQPLMASFQLAHSEAIVGAGKVHDLIELPLTDSYQDWPLGLVASFHEVVGKALHALGEFGRATQHFARALRVLHATGDVTAIQQLNKGNTADNAVRSIHESDQSELHCLDAAVALLEFSGHPHILGHEAFAILKDTECTRALALGAASPRGIRLIAAHGWSEGEALAGFRAAQSDDLIAIGQHRDETWQILVHPRPQLSHRCTVAAIRKLVAIARTLDQYRRDEKQRAALWPTEELDRDAESLWISEQSTELLRIARRVADAPGAVLLTGETGTGKEMLARVMHRSSRRADRPLQPFNCTAVPRDMLESQLFGHRKGAFTGADISFPGVIRAAAGGTLFLDEIGEVGIEVQPKLLRFLEQQEVHPLGEPHPLKVDVRIIAATNANLEQLVAQGRFREDLFYRLKVIHLHLPPLRERREEIPPLAEHYLRKFGDEQRKGHMSLSDETLEYLLLYSWPGNIRQLANEVRRMITLAEPDSTLTPAQLSPEIQASRRTFAVAQSSAEPEIRLRLDQPLPAAVDALEQMLVRRALERSHGRVEEAARLLGISRKGLFLKRRRWGIREAS
jgi:DNA-binding NtrC family response regulator/tetratricopeptide (TPR) repeat protein